MSRNSPVPDVDIIANIFTDSETGINTATIIIDVKVGDYSNGILILDEPEDLHILRKAIDDYISCYKIKAPSHMNTEENKTTDSATEAAPEKPRFLGVIEGFINTEWMPTRGFIPDDITRFRILTSQEIIIDLADMVDIELNDVAQAMIYLGYRTIVYEGKVGWLLERRPR